MHCIENLYSGSKLSESSRENKAQKMADSLIKTVLVKDLEMPAFVKKKFNVRCCIRGYDIYQTEIGARLTTVSETRPGALVEDKYTIAIISNGKTVGHVPKFLTKLTLFFLKNGGKLHTTVTRLRKYFIDLKQVGLEFSCDFYFSLLNENLFLQMKRCRSLRSKRKKLSKKKKRKRN